MSDTFKTYNKIITFTNVNLKDSISETDEYWVKQISDTKMRYKYSPKREKTEIVSFGGLELSIPI